MSSHNANPVRTQIRQEIVEALADGQPRTAEQLYGLCPSATDASEVSKIAYELRRTGLIAHGDRAKNATGMGVHTYLLAGAEDPRLAAARPIVVERKIVRTGKAPKPAASNPYARFTLGRPQDTPSRVTRDLPIHLQSAAPVAAQEAVVSQEPAPYINDPDVFSNEPRESEDTFAALVDAFLEMDHMEQETEAGDLLAKMVTLPVADDDDPAEMASADVGEIAEAMSKRNDMLKKVCKCLKINRLPRLPQGYIYGGIKVWIESEHDVGRMTITTHDEGDGVFCSLKARGHLSFDPGDLATIGQVADALIQLHEDCDHDRG